MGLDDDELHRAFLDATLPFDQWTHQAHLRVAYLRVSSSPFRDAVDQMREGIRRYNRAHDVPDAPNRGYHETITVAYMMLVAAATIDDASTSSKEFIHRHPELLDRSLLARHYSRDSLFSPAAKKFFLAPDLEPLPVISPSRVYAGRAGRRVVSARAPDLTEKKVG